MSRKNRSLFFWLNFPSFLLIAFLLAPCQLGWSQAQTGGGLRGTVKDTSGAVVTTGTVHLVDPATTSEHVQNLNAAGQFTFSDIPPGTYTLRVDSAGFQSQEFVKVEFILNEVRELNVTLTPGNVTQQVEVHSDQASVVTLQTEVGTLIDEQRIKELPLNGRDFQNLIYLAPGATRSAGGTGQGSTISAGGSRPTNNNFLIDGGDANDPRVPSGSAGNIGNVTSSVPLDAIAEFNIITSGPTAEFGRSSGSVLNVVTKTGTNDLHISTWEYLRNSALNTRNFFNPVGFKSPFQQNQFGFWAGGKIIPDRTFYSVSYEGFRQRSTSPTNVQIPTAQFIGALTNPLAHSIFQSVYPSVQGQAFSPTNTSTWATTVNRNIANDVDADTGFARFDQIFSSRNQGFATFSIVDAVPSAAHNGGNLAGTGVGETQRVYHIVLQDTHTFTANLLNSARISYQRTPTAFPTEDPSTGALEAGALRTGGPNAGQNFSSSVASPNGLPTISFNSGRFNTIGIASNQPQGRAENVLTYQDSLSWEHGRHLFKAGFQLSRVYDNTTFSNAIRPSIALLDTSFANINALALNSQAQDFYNSGSSERGYRLWEQGYFVEDTYRITNRVTINAGLRYELFPPFTEVNNLLSNAYILNANGSPNKCESLPFNSDLSNVAVVNPSKFGIGNYCSKYDDFGPRLGVAWDVRGNGETVVRAGYGVYYDRVFGNVYGNTRFNPPYTVSATLTTGDYTGALAPSTVNTTTPYSLTTVDPALRNPLTQSFNLAVGQQIDKDSVLTLTYVGALGQRLLATQRPDFGTSFAYQFRPANTGPAARSEQDIANTLIRPPFADFTHHDSAASSGYNALLADYRRRLSHGLTVEGAYTWSHSRDDLSDDVAGSTDSSFPQATIENLVAPYMAANSNCPAAQGNASSAARLTAAVQCASGQPNLTQAQAATLFLSQYTRVAPIKWNFGDSAYDVRNRFAGSVIYQLPIGNGHALFENLNPVANKFVEGWAISSIVDSQSGTPFLPTTGADSNRDGDTNDRAVVTGPLGPHSGHLVKNFSGTTPVVHFFSSCLTSACGLGAGDGVVDPRERISRGLLREPGINNWDMQLVKQTNIHEKFNMRFSADFFNVLNHTNFSTLTSSIASSTFGQALSQRSLGQTESRQIQFGLKLQY
ncbi:hypothetical protein HNQ77_001589 [Silvibacterium bohemicum]|uniref:TonB-dependent receptor-like beta-barrel domain-containing protein n=1 Tax=Silvibacterium bohemicum TaxID=1577686 RepID=A0A841JR67_9BACT|nr:carboxypeptidase regulatory-like domain-containing protein [Silvibacterium bohemicum]MBB6143640.1 hypothetical protein [Silvibacterium bohemicum]